MERFNGEIVSPPPATGAYSRRRQLVRASTIVRVSVCVKVSVSVSVNAGVSVSVSVRVKVNGVCVWRGDIPNSRRITVK